MSDMSDTKTKNYITKLDLKIKKNIKEAAQDASVQKAILNSMFDGRDENFVFEYMFQPAEWKKLSSRALDLIFGPKRDQPNTEDEEDEFEDQNIKFGALYYASYDTVFKLIEQVKKNIIKKL